MDFYNRITTNTEKLNKTELTILDFCLKNPTLIKNIKISDLAEKLFTSPASIVRFSKKLGFSGFAEFKASFGLNMKNNDLKFNKNFKSDCSNLFNDINKSIELVNENIVDDVIEILYKSNRIEFFWEGSSRIVCSEVAKKFRTIGKIAFNYDDSSMMYIAAASVSENDVIFSVSLSGETKQIIKALNIAKTKGAKIVSLTDISNNSQSKIADKSLFITSTSFNKNNINIQSRIQALILAEYVFYRYLEKYL